MKHPQLALQIIGRAIALGGCAGGVLGAVYGALLPWYEPLTAIVAERPGAPLLLELPALIIVMLLYGILWGRLGAVSAHSSGLDLASSMASS